MDRVPAHGISGWIARVRAPFFTATLIPIVLGGVAAWVYTGTLHVGRFLLTLLGGLLLHAGANLINDYFDHLSGADRLNRQAIAPFTGGGPALQLGLITPRRARNEALAYFAAGGLIGLYLAWASFHGQGQRLADRMVCEALGPQVPWVLVIGALGVFTGIFYTARLAPLGLGEVALFLDFGPLMVLGTWVVQTGSPAWTPVWVSLPVAFLISNVLWINQFPDAVADAQVGKRHWVVRLGRKRALSIYGGLFLAAYLSLAATWLAGLTPVWTLLALLPAPLAWRAWRVARVNYDRMPELAPANALTVQTHLLTGVFLIVGYLIQGLIG